MQPLTLLLISAGLAGALACSSNDDSALNGGFGTPGAGTGDSASTTSGGSGRPGASSTGGLEMTTSTGTTGGSPHLGDDDVCVGVTLEAESLIREVPREITVEKEIPKPVALYIMLDNSKSMGQTDDGTHTTWEQAEIALNAFVQDPASAYLDIGIQYFHPAGIDFDLDGDGDVDSDERPDECNGAAHARSAIEVGRLPEAASAVAESLASTGPQSNTPTVGALTGSVAFCTAFQQQHPEEQCIVVFITDGQPNGCGLDLDCHPGFTPDHKGQCVDPQAEAMLTPIAAAGASAGVKTFTVGMVGVSDDGFALLDALAIAGGTDCTPNVPGQESCNISETGGAGLLAALNLIRETIVISETQTITETIIEEVGVPCTWSVPAPPAGETLAPQLVNVKLDYAGQQTDLGQVPNAADCSGLDGWYYDNPVAPTSIHVCPQTCATVEANPDLKATVVFGCATDIIIK